MISALNTTDGYKVDHRSQYPKGTVRVVSNWTPRKSRVPGINKAVLFGVQALIIKDIMQRFNDTFFSVPKEKAINDYRYRIDSYLGRGSITYEHVEDLWNLGFLPIEIRALPEGSWVPIGTPMLTIHNTLASFYWLTNFLETLISCSLWMPCTSATTARAYREVLDFWAEETGADSEFVTVQGHDFSFRGMPGVEAAAASGAGHLLSFTGTDSIPAIDFLEEYYGAEPLTEVVGVSVPATEHSVMCMHEADREFETFKTLITETYPTGIVSIVSDTWNLWKVFEYLERLKPIIMARDGKVVIRPDSSWTTPSDILCGIASHPKLTELNPDHRQLAIKGVVENLWDIFGGTINDKGYRSLDPHIGCIYGDAITLQGANEICGRLATKGFESTSVVFGIGSFTYQHVTRDTLGFAMKATWGEIMLPDGRIEVREIYKDPITDKGEKKSAKGLLFVWEDENTGEIKYKDGVSWVEFTSYQNLLKPVFRDGKLLRTTTLKEMRGVISKKPILQKQLVL